MDWTFTNVCIINVAIYIIVVKFADVKQTLVKLWYTEMGGFEATGYWMLLVSLGKWPWWSFMQLINWWMSNKHESRNQKLLFIGFSQTHLENEPRWTRNSGEIPVKSGWFIFKISPDHRSSHLDWPEVLVFIWPLTRIMKSLVEDKEARINEVMKMMGMPADARWMWNPVEPYGARRNHCFSGGLANMWEVWEVELRYPEILRWFVETIIRLQTVVHFI